MSLVSLYVYNDHRGRYHPFGNVCATTFIVVGIFQKRKPAIYDSDIEDSAESSSDDESPPVQPVDSAENILAPDAA